jgi:nucleotide-binding universal stress UspA family protein
MGTVIALSRSGGGFVTVVWRPIVIAIDRILCPVDFSDFSRHALEYAVAMAKHYDARVTVLHVYANVPVVNTVPAIGFESAAIVLPPVDPAAVRTITEEFAAGVQSEGRLDVRVQEAPDTVAEILAQADVLDANLIVIGSHGRSGFERLFLGSIAGKVLRKSRRPVMVVPAHTTGAPPKVPFSHLLCPIDFSEGSTHALNYALHLAQESDARLTLLHAVEIPPELHDVPLAMDVNVANVRAAVSAEALRRLQAKVPVRLRQGAGQADSIETRVVEGKAHREILKAACQVLADLIVMGVHGRGAVDLALFGSNTLAVVHGASCPVLTIRS